METLCDSEALLESLELSVTLEEAVALFVPLRLGDAEGSLDGLKLWEGLRVLEGLVERVELDDFVAVTDKEGLTVCEELLLPVADFEQAPEGLQLPPLYRGGIELHMKVWGAI